MDNIILHKVIVILLMILWACDILRRKKKKQNLDPAIAQANAAERYHWRYLRWGWRLLQLVCCCYLLVMAVKILLR
jgi:hypothetical protein